MIFHRFPHRLPAISSALKLSSSSAQDDLKLKVKMKWSEFLRSDDPWSSSPNDLLNRSSSNIKGKEKPVMWHDIRFGSIQILFLFGKKRHHRDIKHQSKHNPVPTNPQPDPDQPDKTQPTKSKRRFWRFALPTSPPSLTSIPEIPSSFFYRDIKVIWFGV